MEFSIPKKDFLKILGMIQTLVERRSTIPILSNALIQADETGITLTATDLETATRAHSPASVRVPGDLSLSARKLFEIVRELPDSEVSLKKQDNNWLTLTCEKSVFHLAGIHPEEFPPLPRFKDEDFHPFSATELAKMIERTAFASSTEESRYNLNGVFLQVLTIDDQKSIRMVATDGHRLSLIDGPGSGFPDLDKGIIVPRKGLLEIKKLLTDGASKENNEPDVVYLAISENNFVAKRDKTIVLTRLIEGDFPDYQSVIPRENDKKIRISREVFTACLKRISTMTSEKGEGIVFEIQKGSMGVSSSSHDFGDAREDINVDYAGEELVVGFNGRYVLDALAVIGTEELSLELKDNATAGVLRPVGEEAYLFLVMPMKL
jgi:DNA polymerase-3 subunit beta